MGRNKKGGKAKKEMIVGSDIDDSDQEEVPTIAPAEPEPETKESESEGEEEGKSVSFKKEKKLPPSKQKPQGKKAKAAAKEEAKAAKHADPTPAAKKSGAEQSTSGSESDSEGSDSESEDEDGPRRPVVVKYCTVCTFQAEMCEYSGMFEKCKPWLEENAKELADAEEKGRKRKGVYAEGEGPLPGAKLKKKPEQQVLMTVKKRSGKKVVTLIQGLDFYGINLKEITRDLKKRFSCGCGIVEAAGELDAVEVQGDVVQQMGELLPKQYKVPADEIWTKVGKEKVRVNDGPSE